MHAAYNGFSAESRLNSCRHSTNLDNSDSCSKCENEVMCHSVLNVHVCSCCSLRSMLMIDGSTVMH